MCSIPLNMSEDRLERLETSIAEIFRLCRTAKDETSEIRVSIARLEERQKLASTCPSPGACDRLKEDLKAAKADLDSLKESRTFLKGNWAAVILAASVFTSLFALYLGFKKTEASANYAERPAAPAGLRP